MNASNAMITARALFNPRWLMLALLPIAAGCQLNIEDGDTGSAPGEVGAPGDGCGGLTGVACAPGLFCDYAPEALCGAADQTGTCAPIPEACTEEYNPVCGCDGRTYGNACAASAHGVSVVASGECDPPPGSACGGIAGFAYEPGFFCNYAPEALCGAADQTGVCEPIPDACTAEYNPVCGCDDRTYSNACAAHQSGISVVASGECAPPSEGPACGGLAGLACDEGFFCNYALEALCGAADQTGVCESIPEGCTKEYNPVCGCDDVTYGNACMAHAAGVSVAALGACARP